MKDCGTTGALFNIAQTRHHAISI